VSASVDAVLQVEGFSADTIGMRRPPTALLIVVPVLLIVAFVALPTANRKPVMPAGPDVGAMGAVSTPSVTTGGAATARTWPSQMVSVLDYLPRTPVTDGSVDYTAPLQTAIDDAAGRTLLLPDFPLLVKAGANKTHCLLVTKPIRIVGMPGSVIREAQGRVQILRVDSANDVLLENFTIQGKSGVGQGLAHGICQVWRGTNVTIRGVTVLDSDADGIVIASVTSARIVDCRVARASKSGIYLSQCQGAVVDGCTVEDGRGHRTAAGNLVGSAIQLSSNTGLTCVGNVVRGGVGIGILCDANDPALPPQGNVINSNRVENVRNTENMDVSCGIRLQNSATNTDTQTMVIGNSIDRCGVYGIYVENHGKSSVVGNTIRASERSGLVIGTLSGLFVSGNTILDCDVGRYGNSASIYLVNQPRDVEVRGNSLRNDPSVSSACACAYVQNPHDSISIEPVVRHGARAPMSGTANRGDVVWNNQPMRGSPLGWVCTASGTPGTWTPLATVP